MRPMVLLKWSFLLGSLGVALLLAPPCKAQEIAADQFDSPNTEPFEKPHGSDVTKANKTNHKAASKQKSIVVKGQARKPSAAQSTPLVAAGDLSEPTGKDNAAVSAPRKPKDE